jgi:hypothetical protein
MATLDKKLIAALVSVNYSDFLELVLPFNTKIFDTIYVITTKEDKKCIDICSKYNNVNCFIVGETVLKKNGASFNRGAAYNLLFDKLQKDNYRDWICLTDSDIIFPPNLRGLVSKVGYGPMYSLPRSFCQNENQFKRYTSAVESGKPHSLSVDRRSPKDVFGIGYMQLFQFGKQIRMPENFNDVSKIDHVFRNKHFWKNCKLLYDVEYCVHLGATHVNWSERKSKKWKI